MRGRTARMEAIIIGALHHNTLGVVRSLGESNEIQVNIKVLLVGHGISDRNIITESRYVDRQDVFYVEHDTDIPDWLAGNAEGTMQERVVICCSDGAAEQVVSNYDSLKQWYHLPSASFDITKLMSKVTQDHIAVECGFNVPEWEVVKKGEATEWSVFPCITKPEKSVLGKGKADIHIAFSREELNDYLSEIEAEYVQIQEYLRKDFEYQLIGCSLKCGELVIIPGFTRIIRQPPNTNTGYLVLSPIENLEYDAGTVKRFLTTIGYSGLFSMEFIRDKNGRDYFLEINLRNDGNAYCVKSAGVNLPSIWCRYALLGEVPEAEKQIKKSVYFMPDFLDMKPGIKKEGFLGWIYQFATAKSHSLFNMKDMGPFIYELNRRLGSHMGRNNKKNYRNSNNGVK